MKILSPSLPFHNFLFLLPECTRGEEESRIATSARELTEMGYVYVASSRVREIEDREGIRFLPLNEDLLPAFGAVTGVFVVRDGALAHAAHQAYPEAQVFVIDPRQAGKAAVSAERPEQPWLSAGLLATMALKQSTKRVATAEAA